MKQPSLPRPSRLSGIVLSVAAVLISTGPNPLAPSPARAIAPSPIVSQTALVPNPCGTDCFTDGAHRLIWLTKRGIELYDLRTQRTRLVVTPTVPGASLGPALLSGSWVVYLDDPEPFWTGKRWILRAKNLDTGRVVVIARADPAIDRPGNLFPTLAVSGTTVVWNFWHGQLGDLTSLVATFNLATGHTQILARAHTPDSLADVAVSGIWAVWVRIHTVPRGDLAPRVTSRLWLENLQTHRGREVDRHLGASEPSIWGRHLVYKATPTRYEPGDLYLYDIPTARTTRITNHGLDWGIDTPFVGASVIAWSELSRMRVGIYDLATQHLLHPKPENGGRAYTAGHILVYVASNNGKNGTAGYRLVVAHVR